VEQVKECVGGRRGNFRRAEEQKGHCLPMINAFTKSLFPSLNTMTTLSELLSALLEYLNLSIVQ